MYTRQNSSSSAIHGVKWSEKHTGDDISITDLANDSRRG